MDTRRNLTSYPLADALDFVRRRELVITMGVGQWDAMLAAAYEEGWILLEINDDEKPVRAYRKSPQT